MNGGQDLGGMMGLGPIVTEPDEPRFHGDWEKRVFAMAMTMGLAGCWNIDGSRFARESLHPAEYMTSSYYAIWFKALEKLVLEHGLVVPAEIAQGVALAPPVSVKRVIRGEEVPAAFDRGWPSDRPVTTEARFADGDEVRARNMHPTGHTRLPRYARGKYGTVERVHGVFVFPDTAAHGEGEHPQWLYTVRFSGRELWGEEADAGLAVSINAWESYLEPA